MVLPVTSTPAKKRRTTFDSLSSDTLSVRYQCPVSHCPKASFASEQGLFQHVNSHCRAGLDAAHHVPESFFTQFNRRFCLTCFCIVAPNPRTHHGHDIIDSMPIKPGNSHGLLTTPTAPSPMTVPLLTLPDVEDILSLSLPTIRHIPRSNRNQRAKALTVTSNTQPPRR